MPRQVQNPLALEAEKVNLHNLSLPFLEGARQRDPQTLTECIQAGVNVNCRDFKTGSTAVHLILAQGCYSTDCVQNLELCLSILLENGADPNFQNFANQTPLHYVVDRQVPISTAKLLIRHGATLVVGTGLLNAALSKKIAWKMPAVAAALLDTAVSIDDENTRVVNDTVVEAVKVDWRYLVYNADVGKETKFLNDVLQGSRDSRRIILTHPVVKAFLHLKRPMYWRHFGFFHCFWILSTLILYIVFIWIVYSDRCKYKRDPIMPITTSADAGHISTFDETTTDNDNLDPNDGSTGQQCDLGYDLAAMAMGTFALFVLGPVFLEWRKLVTVGPRVYAVQWQHWLHGLMLACVCITLYPAVVSPFMGRFYLGWEYGFAAVGMLVGAMSILIQLVAIPFVALYLEMMFKIFSKIFLAGFALSPLLMGFYLAFQILVPTKIGPFDLLTMMVSDTDYNGMIDDERDTVYTFAIYLAFTAFILIVVIVLLNFLIGLAVSDIQELRESAKATNLANQVRSYYLMDTAYGNRRKNHRAVIKAGHAMFHIFWPLDGKDRSELPEDIKLELLQLARARCSHHHHQTAQADTNNNKETMVNTNTVDSHNNLAPKRLMIRSRTID